MDKTKQIYQQVAMELHQYRNSTGREANAVFLGKDIVRTILLELAHVSDKPSIEDRLNENLYINHICGTSVYYVPDGYIGVGRIEKLELGEAE